MTQLPESTSAAEFVCKFWSSKYIFWSSIFSSTANLVVLSFDRYLAVMCPLKYNLFKEKEDGNETVRKRLRNLVIYEIKQAKTNFNARKIRPLRQSNPRRWHREIRVAANISRKDPSIKVADNDINPENHVAVANAINAHLANFSQIHEPLNLDKLPAYLPSSNPPPQFEPHEIFEDLRRININKAGGPDSIPPKVLRKCAFELSVPVTDLINASLAQAKVPTQWKEANVVPVPKQYPATISKLRPISLTSILAKVAEGRVAKVLTECIKTKLDKRQYGNQKGVSTTHCLVDIYHSVMECLGEASHYQYTGTH
ncbi:uncharacterized protein LOC117116866 [Anneissia japonica]|uniref:uncharacterized protein LOC117116866 n=1 Tax=Anneissia japonica TaxID=1529436 RepID=UPI001425849B|nr:uncharacterized protein LOC117116866 [Anneissia japonica]